MSNDHRVALRRWALCLALPAWAWARSPFTPWAASREPRLWLYDALFYFGFVLLAWALAEFASAIFRGRRARVSTLLPLAMTAIAALALLGWTRTEPGLRLQLHLSEEALQDVAQRGYGDQRRRARAFLVDTVRAPCTAVEPWLWLGRPHGAGSGVNRALVRSGDAVPKTPQSDAYAFWPVADGWWMAYQHARRDAASNDMPGACTMGRQLASHRQGLAWIAEGTR